MRALLLTIFLLVISGCCSTGKKEASQTDLAATTETSSLNQSSAISAALTDTTPEFVFVPTEAELATTASAKAADPSAINRCVTEHLAHRQKYGLGQLQRAGITAPCYSAMRVQPPQVRVCRPGESIGNGC